MIMITCVDWSCRNISRSIHLDHTQLRHSTTRQDVIVGDKIITLFY